MVWPEEVGQHFTSSASVNDEGLHQLANAAPAEIMVIYWDPAGANLERSEHAKRQLFRR
ncbi:MAG: hypothetical protein ACOH10_01480 [Rhodoglobus sp.]